MTQYTIYATAANTVGNIVTVNSVGNMFSGLPIVFSGNTFGNITAGATYYIGAVIPGYPTSTITLSSLPGGAVYAVSNATGNMTAVFSSGGQQIINTVPPGESLTDAFTAVNVNFDQLFAAGPVNSNIQIANNTVLTTNTNGNINLVPNGIGAVVVNSSVIPDTANIRNLGSVNNRFSTIYAQYYNMSGNLTPENINTGNLTASGYISAVGNITGNYFFGNGSQLTGINASSNKIVNGNSSANIEFPSGDLAVGINLQPVTGAWIDTYGNIVVNDQYDTVGESVVIDAGGNVYVTGSLYNPIFGQDQAYVRKLDSTGAVLWQKGLPDAVDGSDYSSGETLAIDGARNIYWLVNLWGSPNTPLVAKLNPATGAAAWTTQVTGIRYGQDMTVNGAGQVFVICDQGARITSLDTNGAVLWSFDPGTGGISAIDTGTFVLIGYSAGTVAAYDYSGNILWANQVFDTGNAVWGLAWDGTDWYAADSNGYIMKISGADNSTILWQRYINRDGTGGSIFNTWIEYSGGYIYAGGTGNDGSSDAFITVKIDASTGNLNWARALEANSASQWYWYGHHDISVYGDYYAITGYARPVNSNYDKQVLARLPVNGSLAGSTVGPYRYVNVPALTVDSSDVAGTGYVVPSQPAAVTTTHNYTLNTLVAPYPQVNILSPFTTGSLWTFKTDGSLTLPPTNSLIYSTSAIQIEWNNEAGNNSGLFASSSTAIVYSNGNVTVRANNSGPQIDWVFGADGNLTVPGDINLPLVAKLNSGGIGNTNSAEFGTNVTSNGTAITGSQIYMSAGTAAATAVVDANGNSLMYLGVEHSYPGAFAGVIGIDPGVTSAYALGVDPAGIIQIGAVVGPITTTDYVAGIGVLNGNNTMNGLYANTMQTVLNGGNVTPSILELNEGNIKLLSTGNSWTFDTTGNLTLASTNVGTGGAGSGESGILRGTRRIINGAVSGAQYPYSTVLAAGGTPTVAYTASNNLVQSVKVIFAVEGANDQWEQFDVSVVQWDGNTNYSVSNRVKGNPGIADTVVTATNDPGGNIIIYLNLDASQTGGGWSSFDAVEFGLMVG